MNVDKDHEARIAALEAQNAALMAHIPRMLAIMMQMQTHLETQKAREAARRPNAPAKRPMSFTLDGDLLIT